MGRAENAGRQGGHEGNGVKIGAGTGEEQRPESPARIMESQTVRAEEDLFLFFPGNEVARGVACHRDEIQGPAAAKVQRGGLPYFGVSGEIRATGQAGAAGGDAEICQALGDKRVFFDQGSTCLGMGNKLKGTGSGQNFCPGKAFPQAGQPRDMVGVGMAYHDDIRDGIKVLQLGNHPVHHPGDAGFEQHGLILS